MGDRAARVGWTALTSAATGQVKMTVETLSTDGWPTEAQVAAGAQPRFETVFAEQGGAVVGFALYFHNYSTWEGLG